MEHEPPTQAELEQLLLILRLQEQSRRREITPYPLVRETGEVTRGGVRGIVEGAGGAGGEPSSGEGESGTSGGVAAAA